MWSFRSTLIIVLGLAGSVAASFSPLQAAKFLTQTPSVAPPSVAPASVASPQPSFLLRLSEETIREGLRDQVDKVSDIDENLLGRQVRGQGRLRGEYSFQLAPNEEQAVVAVHFSGVNSTSTVTEAGPVRLYVQGRTQLRGSTRIYLDGQNLRAAPADAVAVTQTSLTCVSTRFERAMVERLAQRIAAREFYADKAERERAAAQRSQEDFHEQINEEARKFIEGMNGPTLHYLRGLFSGGEDSAGRLAFRTTHEALEVAIWPLDAGAALAPRPTATPAGDLEFSLHESLLNQLGDRLAGRTLTWDEMRQAWEVINGRFQAPPAAEEQIGGAKGGVTLAEQEPIRCSFRDGAVEVTVRGSRFSYGGKEYPSMDIRLRYELQTVDGRPRLVRSGAPRVTPGERDPVQPAPAIQDLIQQQFLRSLLLHELDRDLTPDTIAAAGELENLGAFSLSKITIADGWLAFAFTQ